MSEWVKPVVIPLAVALLVFIGGRFVGAFDYLSETAGESVDQAQFDELKESVRRQDNKIDRLIDSVERLRRDVSNMSASLNEVSRMSQDFRLTRQTVESHASEIARLRKRGGYVWDSVNRICERLEMVCATRNAFRQPGNPYPQPDMYALRFAYHKTPAQNTKLVGDVGEGA